SIPVGVGGGTAGSASDSAASPDVLAPKTPSPPDTPATRIKSRRVIVALIDWFLPVLRLHQRWAGASECELGIPVTAGEASVRRYSTSMPLALIAAMAMEPCRNFTNADTASE